MTITRYTVTDTRTMLTPYVYGTAADGWTSTPATFDAPTVSQSDVIAAHKRGESVTGYVVTVALLGVGSTMDVRSESIPRGFDDWDYGLCATYRDDAGEWRRVTVSTEGYEASAHDTATEDATPEARAAYAAHLAAEQARVNEERRAYREEQAARQERAARAEVDREKFVVIARGRNVPVGTVGRVFFCRVSDGAYPTLRAGVATSRRLDANGRAADVVWTAAANCDVLMQSMPADAADVERLYAFAGALAAHLPDSRVEGVDGPAETFPREWERACAESWRLAVFAAYSPADLTTELRRAARDHRTIDEVLECVESSADACDLLASLVTARAEIPATDADGLAAWRRAVRAVIVPCVGVIYVPRSAKTRAPKAIAAA
jgi:hypothetical protein